MSSDRKIQANRRNARLSTGPKTPEGKAIVSRNAQKHGLASRLVVLPGENRQDFLELLEAFRADRRPASSFEESLIFQLAAAAWRLRRVARIEIGLLSGRLNDLRDDFDLSAPPPKPDGPPNEERSREDSRLLGRVFWRSCAGGSLLKLLRYENSFRRAFYKTLHELSIVQARRAAPQPHRRQKITDQSHATPRPAPLPAPEVSSPL